VGGRVPARGGAGRCRFSEAEKDSSSALFPNNPGQLKVANAYIAQLRAAKLWQKPIVTKIEKAQPFYPAEDYHQDYLTLHPTSGYIVYNDLPKIKALKQLYPQVWREKPVLVNG
jgi:peptide-methionine (S)-S-oxide reductase